MDDEQIRKDAAKLLGSQGGNATLKKHGLEHFRARAEHMNKVRKEKKERKKENEIIEVSLVHREKTQTGGS